MTPDTATTPTPDALRPQVPVVIDAMLMGTYGRRVREIAQSVAGPAVFTATERRGEVDPPALLAAIIRSITEHLHSVHTGEIAVQVVNHLLGIEPDPQFTEAMHVRGTRG